MSTEKEIRKILDIKLKNNDINLIEKILSYIKPNCYACKKTDIEHNLIKVKHNSDCEYKYILEYRCIDCVTHTPYIYCPDACFHCD